MADPLWNMSGEHIGWRHADYLYNARGECVGFFMEEDAYRIETGEYIGGIVGESRLARKRNVTKPRYVRRARSANLAVGRCANRGATRFAGYDDVEF